MIVEDKFIKQINSHYEWLETSIQSDSIENQRLKQKIHDFSQTNFLLTMMSKSWYAFLHLNYSVQDIKNNLGQCLLVPLNKHIYNLVIKLIIKALSKSLFSNDKYTVCMDPNYQKKYVHFDRFRYDLCTLVSEHIESETL